MKTGRIVPLLLLLFLSSAAYSQKKGQPASITDPGELYSTYEITIEEKDLIAQQVSPEELENIMKFHTEDTWPEGINELDERTGNADKLKLYKAVKVASFGDVCVLKIPVKKNKHMPADMVGDHDFYFIVGENAVK